MQQNITYTDANGETQELSYTTKELTQAPGECEIKTEYIKDEDQGKENLLTESASITLSAGTANEQTFAVAVKYDEANKASGEIFNSGTEDAITNDFIGLEGNSGYAAIKNTGSVETVTANFINNSVSNSSNASAGALYNYGTIEMINGNFIGNSASSMKSNASGGAVYNYTSHAVIQTISGDF